MCGDQSGKFVCGLRVKNVRYRERAVALSGFVKSLKQD